MIANGTIGIIAIIIIIIIIPANKNNATINANAIRMTLDIINAINGEVNINRAIERCPIICL